MVGNVTRALTASHMSYLRGSVDGHPQYGPILQAAVNSELDHNSHIC
jgi:hypothetical protein